MRKYRACHDPTRRMGCDGSIMRGLCGMGGTGAVLSSER